MKVNPKVRGRLSKNSPTILSVKDPLRIEHHWQTRFTALPFSEAEIFSCLPCPVSIRRCGTFAGKYHGLPAYQLLGGAVRDRIRVYAHWGIGSLTDEGKSIRERTP